MKILLITSTRKYPDNFFDRPIKDYCNMREFAYISKLCGSTALIVYLRKLGHTVDIVTAYDFDKRK